jgi:galactose mutarotase-like enzyme
MIEIASEALSAAINPLGAELWWLRDAAGRDLMTDADPAFWTGHAPLLFPIVGALRDGRYRLDGQSYAMGQHGFARRQEFGIVEHDDARVVFRLTDTDETHALYPFAFALDAAFTLTGATLLIEVTVANRGDGPMPASLGFHPAFAWPLPYGERREDHRIVFEQEEPSRLAHIRDALIAPETVASPLDGRTLKLRDDLFANDALVWPHIESRSATYGAQVGPQLEIGFDAPMLGIWTRPGAHYVCVEPWHGIADPAGFEGEIWDKPGILRFAPGESRTFTMRVTLRP